jgi:hypothetical protein
LSQQLQNHKNNNNVLKEQQFLKMTHLHVSAYNGQLWVGGQQEKMFMPNFITGVLIYL